MLPFIVGGAIYLIAKALFDEEDDSDYKRRVFVSFAMEDKKYRDFLVAQSKNERTPFEFIDMSVKKPWDEDIWKEKCRKKIRSCDGMIVLLSNKTWHSSGVRWEIKCAKDERIPVVGMHIRKGQKSGIPPELRGSKIIDWSWDNLDRTISRF